MGRVLERVTGIEPASSAWEAEALPLDDTRLVTTSNILLRASDNPNSLGLKRDFDGVKPIAVWFSDGRLYTGKETGAVSLPARPRQRRGWPEAGHGRR